MTDFDFKKYTQFWNWFSKHYRKFHQIIIEQKNIESDFVESISIKLKEINPDFFILVGLSDNQTAELVITADGNIACIPLIEDFVSLSPKLEGWKFSGLKQAHETEIDRIAIEMEGVQFTKNNISFYPREDERFPDEIEIVVVHQNMNDDNVELIVNGLYLFLDNYLGELALAENIDQVSFVPPEEAEKELIPIEKLKGYVLWRQKEFVEKYTEAIYPKEESFSIFEANIANGNRLLATINTKLLEWGEKASTPWIVVWVIPFGEEDDNEGLPDEATYSILNDIEDKIIKRLPADEGYLFIGWQTANGVREMFFACREFRKPARVFREMNINSDLDMDIEIYKDKYWQSFARFKNQPE